MIQKQQLSKLFETEENFFVYKLTYEKQTVENRVAWSDVDLRTNGKWSYSKYNETLLIKMIQCKQFEI